jgi:hypothetical protein
MIKNVARAALVSLALASFVVLALAPPSRAGLLPLRSGTVVSKKDAGVYTYIKAVDDAGKEFWILTSICTVGEKGKIAVMAGAHYDKIRSEHLDATLDDVYTADLLMIGDQEVTGFGAHGLPSGCAVLH